MSKAQVTASAILNDALDIGKPSLTMGLIVLGFRQHGEQFETFTLP
jgi:hypothetical protein